MQLDITPETAALTAMTTVVAVIAIIALVRIRGLRSFAKMGPHDFATTIATGSILGATAAGSVPLAQGIVALSAMFTTEWLLARWRPHGGSRVLDNAPMLLMAGPNVLWQNLEQVGVTEADLRAKLREANVLRYSQVLAVVFEGTGDISVLHGDGDGDAALLDVDLLAGVRGLPASDAAPQAWRRISTLGA